MGAKKLIFFFPCKERKAIKITAVCLKTLNRAHFLLLSNNRIEKKLQIKTSVTRQLRRTYKGFSKKIDEEKEIRKLLFSSCKLFQTHDFGFSWKIDGDRDCKWSAFVYSKFMDFYVHVILVFSSDSVDCLSYMQLSQGCYSNIFQLRSVALLLFFTLVWNDKMICLVWVDMESVGYKWIRFHKLSIA